MVRWGQAPLSPEMLSLAKSVWRPDLYDAALPGEAADGPGEPADGIGAFAGPAFDPDDVAGHLAAWPIRHARSD
jgi:NitT/TauT family transport system ATP-binding protein